MEKQTLLSYRFYPSYEEYIRYCEMCGITPESKNSENFSDFKNKAKAEVLLRVFMDCIRDDVKEFNYILENYWMYFSDSDKYQEVFNSILEVLTKLVKGGRYFELVKNGNTIYIFARDGLQYEFYKLHAISDIGLERFKRNGSVSTKNKENVKSLPNNIFKTKQQ